MKILKIIIICIIVLVIAVVGIVINGLLSLRENFSEIKEKIPELNTIIDNVEEPKIILDGEYVFDSGSLTYDVNKWTEESIIEKNILKHKNTDGYIMFLARQNVENALTITNTDEFKQKMESMFTSLAPEKNAIVSEMKFNNINDNMFSVEAKITLLGMNGTQYMYVTNNSMTVITALGNEGEFENDVQELLNTLVIDNISANLEEINN